MEGLICNKIIHLNNFGLLKCKKYLSSRSTTTESGEGDEDLIVLNADYFTKRLKSIYEGRCYNDEKKNGVNSAKKKKKESIPNFVRFLKKKKKNFKALIFYFR